MSIRCAKYFAFIVLSLTISLLSFGYSTPNNLVPSQNHSQFTKVAKDAWIVDGSQVELLELLPVVSVLELRFDTWRPATKEPAHIELRLCNEVRELLLVKEASSTKLRVPLSCLFTEAKLEFKIFNPVRAGPSDTRMVAARLLEVKSSSYLGFPIVLSLNCVLLSLIAFAGLILIQHLFNSRTSIVVSSLTYLAVGALLTANSNPTNLAELYYLQIFILVILAGAKLAKANGALLGSPVSFELSKKSLAFLGMLVVVLGAALRFYTLNFGLPAPYHPDELVKVKVIQSMIERSSLNPEYFLHPSMLLYSGYSIYSILEPLGFVESSPSGIILSGRIASALAGSFSVLLLILIGRSLFSTSLGLVSGAILALSPLHVTCSRYMKEDALLVFCILLTTLVSVHAAKKGKLSLVVLAALCAGLSSGAKYTGVLAGGIVLSIAWLSSQDLKPNFLLLGKSIGTLIIVMPIGFLLITPYALLDFPSFYGGISYEKKHMLIGHSGVIDSWSQYWMYHLRRSILPGYGAVPLLVSVLAMGVALWRRSILWLVVATYALAMYLPAEWVKAKPAPQAERYIVPVLAFLSLLTAWLLLQISNKSIRVVAVILVLLSPAYSSLRLAMELGHDTREQLSAWMHDSIPAGATIAIDGGFYAPAFLEREYQVKHLHAATKPWEYRSSRLENNKIDYVLLTSLSYDRYFSQPNMPAELRSVYRSIFRDLELVKEVKPKYKTYGFHNPTLKLYAVSSRARARLSTKNEQ